MIGIIIAFLFGFFLGFFFNPDELNEYEYDFDDDESECGGE